jgi:hypothetical protein
MTVSMTGNDSVDLALCVDDCAVLVAVDDC